MEKNSEKMQEKWNKRYGNGTAIPAPLKVLTANEHLLPTTGEALDLACGLGANALYLAARGFKTVAWDISSVALARLQDEAKARKVTVTVREADLSISKIPPDSFDVITVGHFLERGMVAEICRGLRVGGLLYYQTFTRDRISERGPDNPAFRLGENELLELFAQLQILVYREEGLNGDITQGCREEAYLVGQRRV